MKLWKSGDSLVELMDFDGLNDSTRGENAIPSKKLEDCSNVFFPTKDSCSS